MSSRFFVSFALVGCLSGFLTLVSLAQPADFQDHQEMPDGYRGQRISALISAFNENDAAAVEKVMHDHFTETFRTMASMEQHASVFRSTYRQTGGVDFYGIRSYDPPRDYTVVVVRDRLYGGWHSFVTKFEDERISSLNFAPARPPVGHIEPALTESELIHDVRRTVDRICSRDAFSGSVLVARGDEVLYEHACGEASKRFSVPNNIDTKFNIGSMNKMFTATAIMQLVEEGRIAVEDTVSRYVDESWLPREITDKITIHHLLTHTSGLGSYFNDTFWDSSRLRYRDLADFKPLLEGETLAHEPGAKFRYSNTGMLLLGVVIETVTGESYFDVIREKIYNVAGMPNSDSFSMDEPVPNLAIGYIPAENEYGWRNNILDHVVKGGPAGGGFSTVRDLHRFATALMNGDLVSPESLEKMWTSHSDANYGYGFGVSHGAFGKSVGHSGGFPGLNGQLNIFPESGYVIAVLSNYDRSASPLAEYVKRQLDNVGTY